MPAPLKKETLEMRDYYFGFFSNSYFFFIKPVFLLYIPNHNTTFLLWTNKVLYGIIGVNHPVNWIIVNLLRMRNYRRHAQLMVRLTDTIGDVPLIFMGKGINPEIATDFAGTIDINPTLAMLVNIDYSSIVEDEVLNVR